MNFYFLFYSILIVATWTFEDHKVFVFSVIFIFISRIPKNIIIIIIFIYITINNLASLNYLPRIFIFYFILFF